jgi:cytochrome c-type biogenesis protein CcmH/NrfF
LGHLARSRQRPLGAIRIALLATLLCVAFATAARAADDAAPGWGYAMANELMSPYCPGRALPDCPSPQAAELRQWIVAQERDGRSHAEVLAELLGRFGEGMLQQPRASGFGLTAYMIPILGVVAGGALLVVFFRRQAAKAAPPVVAPRLAPVDPEIERLVDEEFRRARDGA